MDTNKFVLDEDCVFIPLRNWDLPKKKFFDIFWEYYGIM